MHLKTPTEERLIKIISIFGFDKAKNLVVCECGKSIRNHFIIAPDPFLKRLTIISCRVVKNEELDIRIAEVRKNGYAISR